MDNGVRELTVKLLGDADGLTTALSDAKGATSNAIGDMTNNFQDGMKKISIATGAVAVGITAFAKSSTDYLENLTVSSKALAMQTGMTIEQSSTMIAVFGRLGISADQTATVFRTFSKQISDSQTSTGQTSLAIQELQNKIDVTKESITATTAEIAKNGDASGQLHTKLAGLNLTLQDEQNQLTTTGTTLDQLGVKTVNADGSTRSFNDILLSVADKFKAMPDGAQKSTDAIALFGRSGLLMLPILDQGAAGIQQLEDNATKLGLTLTTQNIGAVSAYIKSQKDLKDSTDAIKISVGTLTAPVLTKLNDILIKTMNKFIGIHGPAHQVVTDILAFGGPVLGAVTATTAFLGNLSSMGPLLELVSGLMLNPIFLIFAATIVGITTAVLDLHDKLGSWSAVLKDVQDKAEKLYSEILNYLEPVFEALWKTIKNDVQPAFVDLWKNVLEPLAEFLVVTFIVAIKFTAQALNELLKGIAFVITGFVQLTEKFESLDKTLRSNTAVIVIGQYFQQVLWPILKNIWNTIDTELRPAVEKLLDSFSRLWQALEPGLTDALKVIAGLLVGDLMVGITAVSVVLDYWVHGWAIVASAIGILIDWIGNLIGWLGNLVGIVINTVKTIGDIFANLWPAIKDVFGLIIDAFAGLGGAILAAIGDFGSLLYDTGKSLVTGLVKGIKDSLKDVEDAIGNVGSSAVSKIKSILGIHSPSTVFAEIGANLGQGLINGINGSVNGVKTAVGNLAVQPTKVATTAVQQTGSQTSQSNPNQSLQSQASGGVSLVVNIGMYAGMAVEKRQIALELYKELVRAARSQGVSLPMIGAVGVQ